ncbi:trypsin-like peptidase domain-containing protein [Nonomuraea sp. M3C6]|uniref:Trypsin-like peptidase domain-containing protein n=1 Tax=Nonomuraea marmarensis TaxID=3351344 RepID=A0ABW7A6I5_9ACTN
MPKTLVTTLTTLAGVALAAPAAAGQPPAATADRPPAAATTTGSPKDQQPVPDSAVRDRTWGAASSPLMRPEQAVRYWTVGKQARARAADLPESLPSPGTAEPPSLSAQGTAARPSMPGQVTAQRPGEGETGTAQRHSVPVGKRLTPGGDTNGYARMRRPYTKSALSRISGRLFFVNAAGQGDSCSASVVRSAVRLLIVTAAHCVYGVPEGAATGRWHSSFAFVPAYDGRAASVRQREPYGRWGGRRAWKPDGFTGMNGGDWNSPYDIAIIEVGRKNGTLQEAVGAFTPMLNQGGKHTIATIGYPGLLGRKPYDGRDQLWCLGRTQPSNGITGADTMLAARATPKTGRMETYNCHLFKGHSGGPWVVEGTGDLVGVLSAGKEDGETDGNSVANALNLEGYGAIVQQADPRGVYDALSIRTSGPSEPISRGTAATVTAIVTMRGLMAAAQVPVTITLPPGTSLGTVTGADCHQADRQATCTIGAVHPGRPARITATVNIAPDAERQLKIVARVTSTRLDPSQKDNTSAVHITTVR